MNDVVRRLAYVLADPSLSEREFDSCARWLSGGGAMEFVEYAYRLRRELAMIERKRMHHGIGIGLEDELEREVGRQLREKAGMTVHEALLALADTLGGDRPRPKESFASGLSRLRGHFGDQKVLSAAHRIARKRTGGKGESDWPLKSEE